LIGIDVRAMLNSFFQNIQILNSDRRREFILRVLIISGVVLVSMFMAYYTADIWSLEDLISHRLFLLIPAAAVVIAFIKWPGLGVAILVFSSLVVPFALGTGTQTSINIAVILLVLLLGLWVFKMFAYDRKITIVPSRTVAPIVVFTVIVLLAFLAGQVDWFYYADKAPLRSQLGGVALFVLSVGAFLLVGNTVKDLRWLRIITWVFLALAAFYIFSQALPWTRGLGRRVLEERVVSGSIFWVWIIALSFSQAVYNRQLRMRWRIALAGLVLATYYVSIGRYSAWTSGWLPSVVALGVIILVGSPRWSVLVIGLAGVVGFAKFDTINRLLLAGDNSYSLMTRLEAWRIVFEIVKVNPFLGLGPSNYYFYTPLFPILGYSVQFNSHNNYVDIIAQTGILGLLCFLWLAWEIGLLGWKLRERVPQGSFSSAYVYGALGGLAGSLAAAMLGDWLIPFVYNIGLAGFRASVLAWLFLGGLVVIEKTFRKTEVGSP
jgi:O-antigen ligase